MHTHQFILAFNSVSWYTECTMLHVHVLVHTYTYSASDINYAVHRMEQESEIERLRKQQATMPHRSVKTT